MRSKSPVRSRSRSVGPWSSPRRRLPEGSSGHQDSSQHRSPVMYREDRMRSSPQISFTEKDSSSWRDSPSYTTHRLNDMRDVDAVQEHGHPRSLSNRRSPPDRAFTRSNRRVEIFRWVRGRADADEHFDGPLHTGRFPELHSGESTDERSRYGERRGGGPRQMGNVEEQEENSCSLLTETGNGNVLRLIEPRIYGAVCISACFWFNLVASSSSKERASVTIAACNSLFQKGENN
ncbi:hypothetical protein HAX54_051309 [Datura stramonium]|uniref:Uncharacterized protein n=1 Tax=Datura stramonium TaxID=4076 RepID=A0ABS8SY52_DATST|nr:hypothetical protein [Datura stramonium]